MSRLELWHMRSIEEANLFNPAFLCVLIQEFLKEYMKTHSGGAPLTITIIALTTSLHRASRERLPNRTVTPLYAWLQGNEDLLVGFAERARNLSPFIKEALLFGMATKALDVGKGHCLLLGPSKTILPKSFIEATTSETRVIIDRTKFMGRWIANSGSEVSVMAAWGVKP